MNLPFLQEINNTQVRPLTFSGLNKRELIKDDEFSGGINLDSELNPAISPRKPISHLKTLASPSNYLMVEGKQVYTEGTNLVYGGVVRGQLTLGRKAIVDFNGAIVIFPDKKYYDYVDDVFGSFTCPYDIEFTTVHYNRIFGIKGNDVYASKVGDFKIWDDYSGTELDSWTADVYSDGDFTGITTYQDHVVFFKRDQMYELYGYTPSQFKIMESSKVGCVDDRSIAEVGGILYFMSETGVQTYAGGFPRDISEKLNLSNIQAATAIGDGRKYYVCIGKLVYTYDSWQGVWMPYMDMDVLEFAKSDNDIYALATNGKLYQLGIGPELVEWEATTKNYDDSTFKKKSVRAIRLKVQMDEGAELLVFTSTDERNFILHKTIKQNEMFYRKGRDIIITIPIKRAENYQIKLVGKGKSIVYGEREFIVGSDR